MDRLKLTTCTAALLVVLATAAHGQNSCSSDGQPRPAALLERFINADCEPCWRDAATPRERAGELALDWIGPGGRGEDAPLAAVAIRETGERLKALGLERPLQSGASRRGVRAPAVRLRVAHGLAFNGYIGTSIELKPGRGGPWQAWLLLVERLPAGTEGSPVERHLVRNALRLTWDAKTPRSPAHAASYFEARPMAIAAGANPARLLVVGWVEDAGGRLRGIAASGCTRSAGKG